MPSKIDTHFAKKGATKDTFNDRSVAADPDRGVDVTSDNNSFQAKQRREEASQDNDVVILEPVAGAYYLPILADKAEAWEKVKEAMNNLEKFDVEISDEEHFTAHGVQYFRDTYMLARTGLCQLENKPDNTFLELRRLEGDGFVFADQFKKQLVSSLGGVVSDVPEFEPAAPEETIDPSLQYLDFSDEAGAGQIITMWLDNLRPGAGIHYDQKKIYESISALAWNCTSPDNFKVLADYGDDIVDSALEVIRHEETKFLPTVYFAALCLNTFVKNNALAEDQKTWGTIVSICEAMDNWSLPSETSYVGQQVTRSTEVTDLLFDALKNFGSIADERSPKATEVIANTFSNMGDMFAEDNSEAIASLAESLNVNLVEDDQ